MRLVAGRLREAGHSVVETIEPGGTGIGKQIRRILLDPANAELHARAELLLYFASRAQNVEQIVRPALASGAIVLCDRWTDSTLVYQGCGRGLEMKPILQLDELACRGLTPGMTVLIDIDSGTSRARAALRNQETRSEETRIDDESAAFHDRVRDGYHELARANQRRIVVIDGSGSIEEVAARVWTEVSRRV